MSVIKYVIFIVYFCNTAMIVSKVIQRLPGFAPVQINISVRDNGSAIPEFLIRIIRNRIAQFMTIDRGIDKVIFIPNLTHGRCLEEFVAFKIGSFAVYDTRCDNFWLCSDCKHICFQFHDDGTFDSVIIGSLWFPASGRRAEAGVQVDIVSFPVYARVKLEDIIIFFSQQGSVCIMNMSVEFVFACGGIANSYRHDTQFIKGIIKVISAVSSELYIRRKQQSFFHIITEGIFLFVVNHALIFPVA